MYELPKTILLVLSSLGIALATFVGDLGNKAEANREPIIVRQELPDIPIPEPIPVESEIPEVPEEPEVGIIVEEDATPPEREGCPWCPFRRRFSRRVHVERTRPTIFPLFRPHLHGTVHIIRDRHVEKTWPVRYGHNYDYWACNPCCRETSGPW